MTAAIDLYGSSPIKRRRRTNAELDAVDLAIIAAVQDEHPVTLRGVYYRVVSAGAVEKTEDAYRLVGRQLLKLRRAGIVPYSWITDGTRWISKPDSWSDLDEMLEDAAASYRRALWHDQDIDVHIFTEKDAISGVVLPVTEQWDVPLGVLRGYASESFAHSVAETVKAGLARGRPTIIYQLGDHDPSGVDAWRDFSAKIWAFVTESWTDAQARRALHNAVRFERLAVTEDQIERWDLPTRPTKRTDTRARGFVGGSVEVDAIPASTLRELVRRAITKWIDQDALRLTRTAEESEREVLTRMIGGGG